MSFTFVPTGQRARMWYAYYSHPNYYYENESEVTFPIYKCDDFAFADGILYADDIGGFDKLSQLQNLDSANWVDLYTIVYDYAMGRGGTTLSSDCLITKKIETDSIVNSDATDRLRVSISGDNYVMFRAGKSYSYHYKTHDCKLIMCIDANGNYGWVFANFTTQEAYLVSGLWTGDPLTISDRSDPFCLRSWLTGFALGLAGKSYPYSVPDFDEEDSTVFEVDALWATTLPTTATLYLVDDETYIDDDTAITYQIGESGLKLKLKGSHLIVET